MTMMWCICAVECYSAIQRNEVMPSEATRMDLGIILLSEASQAEKDNCHTPSLTCGIEKTDTNELIYTLKDSQ